MLIIIIIFNKYIKNKQIKKQANNNEKNVTDIILV